MKIDKLDLFTEKEEKFKSHQKGFYPSEETYKKKNKLTSYKKKSTLHQRLSI